MFVEGMEVLYENNQGFIKFVCDRYVVIRIPTKVEGRNDPLLCVFTEHQKDIVILDVK